VIQANLHKYYVSAMCKVLKISRSPYYYEAKQRIDESELTASIIDIFKAIRNTYGTRKIKNELDDRNMIVSRRRIGRITKQEGLVSSYTTAHFHSQKDTCNESKVTIIVNRKFDQPYRNVIVSDFTYVRVSLNWNYICVLVDLFNREIIGYSAAQQIWQIFNYNLLIM